MAGQIEDTENTHPGVRLMENAGGRLENCTLQRNGYGVAVDNNAQAYPPPATPYRGTSIIRSSAPPPPPHPETLQEYLAHKKIQRT